MGKQNPNRSFMYNSQITWYNKKEVLGIFPISERTYFRKIKNLPDSIRKKTTKNPKGKSSTLIYYKDLLRVFGKYRRPSDLDNSSVKRKYIGTSHWDIIGNIVPMNATINDLVNSIQFIHDLIKSKNHKVKKDWFFYSIERNPNDQYYHCHFLLRTDIKINQLESIFGLICDTNFDGKHRIHIRKYDYDHYHLSGAFYSFKTDVNDKGEKSYHNGLF